MVHREMKGGTADKAIKVKKGSTISPRKAVANETKEKVSRIPVLDAKFFKEFPGLMCNGARVVLRRTKIARE